MMLERFADSCPNQTCGIIIAGAGPLALGTIYSTLSNLRRTSSSNRWTPGCPLQNLATALPADLCRLSSVST